MIGIIDRNIVLNFSLGDDAIPPIHDESINVTFNGSTFPAKSNILVQRDQNLLLISITSLAFFNEGVYAVTVETIAGQETAHILLTVYGNKSNSYLVCYFLCMYFNNASLYKKASCLGFSVFLTRSGPKTT